MAPARASSPDLLSSDSLCGGADHSHCLRLLLQAYQRFWNLGNDRGRSFSIPSPFPRTTRQGPRRGCIIPGSVGRRVRGCRSCSLILDISGVRFRERKMLRIRRRRFSEMRNGNGWRGSCVSVRTYGLLCRVGVGGCRPLGRGGPSAVEGRRSGSQVGDGGRTPNIERRTQNIEWREGADGGKPIRRSSSYEGCGPGLNALP